MFARALPPFSSFPPPPEAGWAAAMSVAFNSTPAAMLEAAIAGSAGKSCGELIDGGIDKSLLWDTDTDGGAAGFRGLLVGSRGLSICAPRFWPVFFAFFEPPPFLPPRAFELAECFWFLPSILCRPCPDCSRCSRLMVDALCCSLCECNSG